MKKKVLASMIIGAIVLASAGCGNRAVENPVNVKEDVNQESAQEEDAVTESNQPESSRMNREDVIEKYMKPMKSIKQEFDDCKDPNEIVSLAQEYNTLAVEGFYAYKDAVGSAPEIDILPRREYMTKQAFYNGLQELLPEYNEMYLTFNEAGCDSEALDPEASDAAILLCKTDSVDFNKVITDFCLIYDGGDTVIMGAVSDYTDANIQEITVYNNRIEFIEVGFKSYTFFDRNGNNLDYDTTYYDFDTNIPRDSYGYTFENVGWSENLNADEDFLVNILQYVAFHIYP